MATDTALEQSFKIMINTCGWSCSCSVCKHPGRLINNLNHITGTGYHYKLPRAGSLKKTSQYSVPQERRPLCLYHIPSSISFTLSRYWLLALGGLEQHHKIIALN
jgi:hypothetical protein